MLAIRMQRTGRKGHTEFRVIVQDSALSPTSGRVVARLGHHNPHSKETVLNTEKINYYLDNGAQPSDRVVRLLKNEKFKLPDWVQDIDTKKVSKTRNPEKLRKNQPAEPKAEVAVEAAPEVTAPEAAPETVAAEEAPVAEQEPEQAETTAEAEVPAEEVAEVPAEEPAEAKPEETEKAA